MYQNLVIYVQNVYEIYKGFSWLCDCVAKKIKKGITPNLALLENSSTLKQITREARKYGAKYGEHYTMNDDRAARAELAKLIVEYAKERANN